MQKMVDQAEIHRKVASGDVGERREAVSLLRENFADLPDKEQAWEDLHRLAGDEDRNVRRRAVRAFGTAFHNIPDKERAWEDLHRLTVNGNSFVRWHVAYALGRAFPHLPDKEHAWEDLIRLMQDKNEGVRSGVAGAICTAFQHVPNKELSWRDLHGLTWNEKGFVRLRAAYVLGRAFPHIPDKKQAWDDLHRLIWDEDHYVRQRATDALGFAFQHVPNKKQGWKDIIRLMQDRDRDVRQRATDALGFAFQHVSDKKQGWKDIIRLMQDRDEDVRRRVKTMLGTVFSSILDVEQAWKDLIELIQNKNVKVRRGAVYILGIAFPHVTDKEQVWEDLYRLTKDKDKVVQISVNHYLGRLSIVRATEAESEESFRSELQKALRFFEEASRGGILFDNPSSFCLPFYRSFYAITSEKEKAEDEVKKYLAEAKSASENSKSKEILIEAVENLAKALSEAKSLQETKLDAIQYNLNTYRQYCDRAADLIGAAEEGTPGAACVLRRGLPIIDNRIKEIIREIQEKARAVCIETRGTSLEELGLATARSAQELPTQDPLALARSLGSMASSAGVLCELITTDDERIHACEQLKNLSRLDLSEQGRALAGVLEYITACIHSHRNEGPPTKTVHISETQKEIVRIAVAQLCFELTESFPFVLKNKDEVKTKVFSSLEIAKHDGANIVCLPELCLCEEWISEIEERYSDMIVIGGSFYKDKMNICPVIMKSDADTHYQPKITPSRNEDPEMTGVGMVSGDAVYIYETRFGRFMVLICRDFDHLLTRLVHRKNLDMIFCPAFNPASANKRFHNAAHLHVEKNPLYILIANTGKYGGTSVFGRLHKDYFGLLVGNRCKDAGDSTYKLCEVKKGQEEVILANFNLIHKSVQTPTPADPDEEIRNVGHIRKIPIQTDRSRI